MNIQKRINALRSSMAQKGIDIYIIPTADFHHSEYVGDYFKFREYMTGFTGSAGTAVFTSKKAGLWTDGRYFIQAEQQLAGSGIDLYRSGEPGVPSIEEFLEKELQEGQILGFDGRTISYEEGTSYRQLAEQNHASVNFLQDLASEIWTDRPDLPSEPAFLLEDQYTGEGIESKLTRVRLKMKEYGCDTHILSSLDDIAWLFNIRGNDIAYCPLVLSLQSFIMIQLNFLLIHLNFQIHFCSFLLNSRLFCILMKKFMILCPNLTKIRPFCLIPGS